MDNIENEILEISRMLRDRAESLGLTFSLAVGDGENLITLEHGEEDDLMEVKLAAIEEFYNNLSDDKAGELLTSLFEFVDYRS